MSDRAFHDAVLAENDMPVELVAMILRGEPLRRDCAPSWRFDEELMPGRSFAAAPAAGGQGQEAASGGAAGGGGGAAR